MLTGDIKEIESHATSLHDIPVFAPASTRIQVGNLIPAPDHVFPGWPEGRSGIENYRDFYTRCRGVVGVASSTSNDVASSACRAPWSSRRQQLVWAGMPTHDRRLKYIEALKQHDHLANVTVDLGQMQFIDQAAFHQVLDIRGNRYSGRSRSCSCWARRSFWMQTLRTFGTLLQPSCHGCTRSPFGSRH